ncbi:hypothetical protein ACJ73_07426 [Blastomyces percursus]|uniref:Uncharacterized protein n=1 Tax=Blastomyces percursus TaxID=1658174 RepID=A0A1J9PY20_9EURO|nr:hypothetical protein ACJ73_07426 [Blastomyces percursus]
MYIRTRQTARTRRPTRTAGDNIRVVARADRFGLTACLRRTEEGTAVESGWTSALSLCQCYGLLRTAAVEEAEVCIIIIIITVVELRSMEGKGICIVGTGWGEKQQREE